MAYNIYKKRIGKYGKNRQEKLENGRRRNFENFLKQSPHYLTFEYNEDIIECVFEPHKQNETKTLMHVLVRATQNFKIGDIVFIDDDYYMFYYLDERKNSGYNRYVVVKTSQTINWNKNGEEHSSKAYFYFQMDNMLKNEIRSRSRMDTLYLENLKLNFLLMPTNKNMTPGSYFEVTTTGIEQYFYVTGIDIVSTPGVMYVSINPTFKQDSTPPPEMTEDDSKDEFFWLKGGDFNE